MKKYLLATTCFVALSGGSAFAADMPAKVAPMAPAPIPFANWTGPYIGGHVGVARMNSECASLQYQGVGAVSCGVSEGTNVLRDTAFAGGVHAGYDFQDGSFVYGVVGDWTWTGLKASIANSSYAAKAKIDWLASFRGRMGLAFDRTLVYVTGGVAFGHVNAIAGFQDLASFSYSPLDKTQVGWVAGVGVEHQLKSLPRWSISGELLYYDLGHANGDVTVASGENYQSQYHFEVFEARVGLNYRF